jgi:hypothetical protein
MENILDIYDKKLLEIWHYSNHSQMLPFIGKNWGKGIKKVLLVGESHFMKNPLNISRNWYEITREELSYEQINDTSSRKIINDGYLRNSFAENRMLSEISCMIKQTSNNEKDFLYFSFLNFFQRPAIKKNEKFDKLDSSISNKVIKDVAEILQPEYLFFLTGSR